MPSNENAAVSAENAAGAAAPQPSDPTLMARGVGLAFLNKFYTTWACERESLHMFYSEDSTLSYAESVEQKPKNVTGQRDIHEHLMALPFEGATVRISSFDAQPSLQGSILLSVHGVLQFADAREAEIKFHETFVLAAQDPGYYVLNDIFRSSSAPSIRADETAASICTREEVLVAAPTAAAEPEVFVEAAAEVVVDAEAEASGATTPTEPSAPSPVAAQAAVEEVEEAAAPAAEEVEVAAPAAPAAVEAAVEVGDNVEQQLADKIASANEARSWASLLGARSEEDLAAAEDAVVDSAPTAEDGQKVVHYPNGVFVSSLPFDVTKEGIRAAFSIFGAVAEIFPRQKRGTAYVYFSELSGMDNCLEAQRTEALVIGGRTVKIVMKRPQSGSPQEGASNAHRSGSGSPENRNQRGGRFPPVDANGFQRVVPRRTPTNRGRGRGRGNGRGGAATRAQ